jgi:hypothetical protein
MTCKMTNKVDKAMVLPEVDDVLGSTSVDIVLGISYLKYFPVLIFSLPSSLSVYKVRFRSASRLQAILGGLHAE